MNKDGWFDMTNVLTAPRLQDGHVTAEHVFNAMKESYQVEVKTEEGGGEEKSADEKNSGEPKSGGGAGGPLAAAAAAATRHYRSKPKRYWIRRREGRPLPAVGSIPKSRGGRTAGRRGGRGGGRGFGGGGGFGSYGGGRRRHEYHDDLSDSSDDYSGGMFGFSASDCEELMMQGIKPWDDEAGAALAVLNDPYF